MVRTLDWKRSEDPRDVVHVVVQALAEGRLVLLPSETSYFVVASALHADAVEQLLNFPGRIHSRPLSLFLRSPDEVCDFATDMSPVAKRVAGRGWPGPLALELVAEPSESLCSRLPASVKSVIRIDDRYLCFQVAAHQAISETLQLLPGPIVGSTVAHAANSKAVDSTTAEALAHPRNGGRSEDEPRLPMCEPHLTPAQSATPGLAYVIDDGATHFGGFATHLRIGGNHCNITAPGVLDQSVLYGLGQLVVLLVCTGNTCRSPMAETLLRAQLQKRFGSLFGAGKPAPAMAISAGLSAYPGGSASPEAVTIMQQRGLSLKDHQSRPITQRLLRQADLVLTMTSSHRQAIVQRWPEAARKTFLLSNNGQDVVDPFGGPTPVYAACADELERFLIPWVSRIDESWLPNWNP